MLSIRVYNENETPLDIVLLTENGILSLRNSNLDTGKKKKTFNVEKTFENALEFYHELNDFKHFDKNFINLDKQNNCFKKKINLNDKGSKKLVFEEVFYGILIKELMSSCVYRKSFINYYSTCDRNKNTGNAHEASIALHLERNLQPFIDFEWGYRCSNLVLEKQHLDSIMSWLSSLGGAFSALGDYNVLFAERARTISFKQMLIAIKLKDPNLISRCWLYCAISLIQKQQFKRAGAIIRYEYQWAKSQPEGMADGRLTNICRGIWAKLKYDRGKWRMLKNNEKSDEAKV